MLTFVNIEIIVSYVLRLFDDIRRAENPHQVGRRSPSTRNKNITTFCMQNVYLISVYDIELTFLQICFVDIFDESAIFFALFFSN